ncbi:hypothetical protein Pelo_13265 [Pelomyxa schiedti]|nr:hypothetical protein Pelo_13265 [Pelomyxa schiedti]
MPVSVTSGCRLNSRYEVHSSRIMSPTMNVTRGAAPCQGHHSTRQHQASRWTKELPGARTKAYASGFSRH